MDKLIESICQLLSPTVTVTTHGTRRTNTKQKSSEFCSLQKVENDVEFSVIRKTNLLMFVYNRSVSGSRTDPATVPCKYNYVLAVKYGWCQADIYIMRLRGCVLS